MSSQFTYPQKLTHVRHLAIKILLNAKKPKLCNIKILVQHPIKTVLFEQFCNTVSTDRLALLLFSNVRETSSYQVFIDIDNLWTRFSTIGERGCAAIDQIQTGHSISIGQFNSSCRWMKCYYNLSIFPRSFLPSADHEKQERTKNKTDFLWKVSCISTDCQVHFLKLEFFVISLSQSIAFF